VFGSVHGVKPPEFIRFVGPGRPPARLGRFAVSDLGRFSACVRELGAGGSALAERKELEGRGGCRER
jgi:hypothetical protein